jgi:glycosyltransferase involved in cell wall biosynthesis
MPRIGLIRQGHYPRDPRVSREVTALADAGYDVDLICAMWPGQPRIERLGRVSIYRLPITRRRGSPPRYLFEFCAFHLAATLLAGALHLRRRYDLIQVNTIPDSLVFAAILPRLFGARVLLDLHECMPEFFSTKYGVSLHHPLVRLLGMVEQTSIRFADAVITCTEPMRRRFVERGAAPDKVTVILNSSNEETFDPELFPPSARSAERFVLMFHGTLEERFGPDLAIKAVALLKDEIPGLHLRIFGDGTFRPTLESLAVTLGVERHVSFSQGYVPLSELVAAIASADAGVVPTKRDAFRDLTHANKMFDLIAMRTPAIVSRTQAVEAYFDDSSLQLFTSEDEHDLARAIRELHADPALRERLVQRATDVQRPYRWVHQRRRYLDLVEALASGPDAHARRQALATEAVEDA